MINFKRVLVNKKEHIELSDIMPDSIIIVVNSLSEAIGTIVMGGDGFWFLQTVGEVSFRDYDTRIELVMALEKAGFRCYA